MKIIHDWRKRNDWRSWFKRPWPGAGHEIVKAGREVGRFPSRDREPRKYPASFIKPSVRLTPWPLQQAKSYSPRFRSSPLKIGSFRWEASSWARSVWSRRRSPFINEKGSFTLVSGVLNDEPIFASAAAATVSGALEGFVRATAIELPKRLRINVVNPTILKESEKKRKLVLGTFLPGVIPVGGWKVGQAYKRAILGAQTAAFTKLIELTQRVFEDRPATSQESQVDKSQGD